MLKQPLGRLYAQTANVLGRRAAVVVPEAGRERGAGEAEVLPDARYGKRRIEQGLVDPCRRPPNRVRGLVADREVLSEGRQFVLNKCELIRNVHPDRCVRFSKRMSADERSVHSL